MTVRAPTSTADAAAPAAPEPQGPYPARRWWLKRLSLLCVLLIAALAGLRLWWGWAADRRLRAALEPIVALGDPVNGLQMNAAPLPPEENAAAYLKSAIGAIVFNDTPSATSYSFTFPPYGNQWDSLAEQSVKKNARIFPIVRAARAHDRADWGTRMQRPLVATIVPYLNSMRHLANTVGDAALYAHFRGDDAAALETIRDVRHVAKTVGTGPFLVSHLVAIGIDMLAQSRLMVIASRLRLAPEGSADDLPAAAPGLLPTAARAQLPRPAARAQVRALIAELLDDRELAEALRSAYAGERATQLDIADWFGEQSRALRPMFDLDALRMLEQDEVLLDAAAQPNWPAAQAILAAGAVRKPPPAPPRTAAMFSATAPPPKREPIDYTRMLSSNLLGGTSMGRAIEHHMQLRTERRMSAVSLAAHLYRADQGQWPPTLEALVPGYLSRVPSDAMAPGDKPLGYLVARAALPDGSDRPVVYSVGRNGIDDTANGAALLATPCYDWQGTRDEWRDLTRWSPYVAATQPATQPGARPAPPQ